MTEFLLPESSRGADDGCRTPDRTGREGDTIDGRVPAVEDGRDHAIALLCLVLTPGIGPRTAQRVLDGLGGPGRAVELRRVGPRELVSSGLDPTLARDVLSQTRRDEALREWDRARATGIRILPLTHPDYPPLLRETPDAPPVLYVRGERWNPGKPHVAIVGARSASRYGIRHATALARSLAARGAVVVSGLARGVDTAVHKGALEGGRERSLAENGPKGDPAPNAGCTVAVLGTGVDRCYPEENRQLAESIASDGALVSELPLGSPPVPTHFPRRNRIIAGLSWGTVVVEAREQSGSLITARLAADANREVFAVPGPIDSERSRGTHALIRSGACLVTSAEDVVAEFPPDVREKLCPSGNGPRTDAYQSGEGPSLSGAEKLVIAALSTWEPTSIDRLISGLELSSDEVYASLATLELSGLIDTLPGDRYVRRA